MQVAVEPSIGACTSGWGTHANLRRRLVTEDGIKAHPLPVDATQGHVRTQTWDELEERLQPGAVGSQADEPGPSDELVRAQLVLEQ